MKILGTSAKCVKHIMFGISQKQGFEYDRQLYDIFTSKLEYFTLNTLILLLNNNYFYKGINCRKQSVQIKWKRDKNPVWKSSLFQVFKMTT